MLSAAAFDMRKTNAKTPSVSGAIVLAGEQKVLGLELGASGEITDRWSVFAGAAFMNGTVENSGTVNRDRCATRVCAEDERQLLDDVPARPAS